MSSPILSTDENAADLIASRVEKLKATLAGMKAVNAALKKATKEGKDDAGKIAAMQAAWPALTACDCARRIRPDFAGRVGFPDFEITNMGANIRRLEKRIPAVQSLVSAEAKESEGAAARMETFPLLNRVRLFFPAKPAAPVIDDLKRSGFRWTPTLGCWQAYMSAEHHAKRIAGLAA